MILRRLFAIAAAISAISAAVVVCVVAASFAVYALLRTQIGPAGASAAVAAIFAVAAVVIAMVAVGQGKGRSKAGASERDPIAMAERLVEMIRGRPWASGAIAVVLGVLALRNPAVIEAVARAFFDAPKTKGRKPAKT